MLSALAQAIAELGANGTVAALTIRIRPYRPLGTVGTVQGDVRPPGSYVRYVIVLYLDNPEDPRLPTSTASLGLRCYGLTEPDAEALWQACAAVFRRKGPRIASNRLGVFQSETVGGGSVDLDPSNQQPYAYGVVNMIVTTAAVPA